MLLASVFPTLCLSFVNHVLLPVGFCLYKGLSLCTSAVTVFHVVMDQAA